MVKIKIKAEGLRIITDNSRFAISVLEDLIKREQPIEEAYPLEEEIPAVERKVKKTFKTKLRNPWTKEEDKYVFDHLKIPASELARDPHLREKHTRMAIKTRHSVLSNNRFDRLTQDRADFIRSLDAKKSMVKAVTEVRKALKPKKRKKPSVIVKWTDEEVAIIKANINATPSQLKELLPVKRSWKVISNKKHYLINKARESSAK